MNDPKEYYLHSGGAAGADTVWGDLAVEFGIGTIKHWRPEDYTFANESEKNHIDSKVEATCKALGRPFQPDKDYYPIIARDYFQAYYADAVFAIGRIILPGKKGARDFINKSGKQVVDGGTGYAVEMAIQMGKQVYVFDMNTNRWHQWYEDRFLPLVVGAEIPPLSKNFAGIGSRQITPEGIQAIRDVYEKTFKQ